MNVKLCVLGLFILSLSSCYYDSEDKLYPITSTCDTLNVSYTNDINPILQNRCYSCHGNNNTVSVYEFEGYTDLVAIIASQNFLGAIKRVSGVIAMPQGGDKLPDCEINTIEAWINQGKKNN